MTAGVRSYASQKAALTRALAGSTQEARQKAVVAECQRVKKEWGSAWPDDWSRWQRALDDVFPWNQSVSLDDV